MKLLEGKYLKLLKQAQTTKSYNSRESERILARANELFVEISRLKSAV